MSSNRTFSGYRTLPAQAEKLSWADGVVSEKSNVHTKQSLGRRIGSTVINPIHCSSLIFYTFFLGGRYQELE